MSYVFLQPTATRGFLAFQLRKIIGRMSVLWALLGFLTIAEGILLSQGKLAAGATLLYPTLFTLHWLRRLSSDVLENDTSAPLDAGNAAEALSFDVLLKLCGKREPTAADLLEAALETETGRFVCDAMELEKDRIMLAFATDMAAPAAAALIGECAEKAGTAKVSAPAIIADLFTRSKSLQALLNTNDLSMDELRLALRWDELDRTFDRRHDTLSSEWLRSTFGSLGRSWATGYTDELDRLTTDVGENIVYRLRRPVVIHQDGIKNVMRILSRGEQSNVLVLGKPGSGKRSFIENIAFALQTEDIAKARSFTRVLRLNAEQLLSGNRDSDTLLLHALTRAEKSGRFVLVLQDLAQLLKSSDPKTKGVLVRFLQAKHINIIGVASAEEYHAIIKDDPQMDQLFEKIFLEEPSQEETLGVLMTRVLELRRTTKLKLTVKALKSVIELASRYIAKGAFPGKAVAVLDDAFLLAKARGETFVREEHIREVVSLKSNVNVKTLSGDEKERLLSLEGRLKKRIIGQEEAVESLVNVLKRARIDLHSGKKPLGTFLFLGPTGVGKTQTAKTLAEEYFGAADRFIRIDLNEYSTPESVVSIAGGRDGQGVFREGFLTKRVQDNPFSLILLDEIEKAHPHVLNLFLQILDEGSLIDAQGGRTDFRNAIIIATSNAGALALREILRNDASISKERLKSSLLDSILKDKIFTPEFVNRFDAVIVYHPLTAEQAAALARQLLDRVIGEVRERRGIDIELTDEVVNAIAVRGYNPEFGAREMRRTVQETIETYLADYLLKHDVKRGERIVVRLEDLPGFGG